VVAHDCSPRELELELAAFHCFEFRPLLDSGASRTEDLHCRLWNILIPLPPALRENLSLATFKTKLKTYFSGVHNDAEIAKTRKPQPGIVAVSSFSQFRRRDISDITSLTLLCSNRYTLDVTTRYKEEFVTFL